MRRLWAYIVTVFTAIVLVGVTFSTVALNLRSNLEYQSGRELVFRISDKEDEEAIFDENNNSDAVVEIADIMEERLDKAGVTKYEIDTVGYDTIKVRFNDSENSEHYTMISNYLTFNASLAITTSTDKIVRSEDFKSDKAAYVKSENNIPQLVLPVNVSDPFKAVVDEAKKQLEEAAPATEGEEETKVYLYLWYDFVEDVDSYEASQSDSEMQKKILIPFDISQYTINEDGEYDEQLVATVSPQGSTVKDLQESYYRANYYVNLLNASELNYKVTFLYDDLCAPLTESLIALGTVHETIALSRTLIATLVAIAIVSLLLIALYKLGALGGIATTLVSLFGAFSFLILIGVEFNMATIIGIVIVGLASIASVVTYNVKFMEECYRGRSIKKANSEAAKRSLLPIVDINVVIIVIGAFVFLLGGGAMKGLSAALVLGGLSSLVLNTLGLRGLMWMLANTTKLTGKYSLFGVDPSKVPNIVNEEKQSYFGPFADRNFTKSKKPVGIVTAVLFVAALAGMITFGALNKGNFYNYQTNQVKASEIYFEATNNEYAFTQSSVKAILDDMLIYEEGKAEADLKSLGSLMDGEVYVADPMTETIRKDSIDFTYTHYYYVVTLQGELKLDTQIYDKSVGTSNINEVNEILRDRLSNEELSANCTATLKTVVDRTPDRPGFSSITLATFVGVAVLTVYLMLRYRLSRGLTTLFVTSGITGIAMGIFSLLRTPISTYALAVLPGIAAALLIMEIFLMNRERELVLEDRSGDRSVEHRNEIMERGTSYSATMIMAFLSLALVVSVCFYGFGPLKASSPYIILVVGLLLGALVVLTLFGPISQLFYKLFSKVQIERKPKARKKKKNVKVKKSAEPEEAIFIGIND